jgi:hypothetical protein
LREGHANLERDACFLRQDDGRPDGLHGGGAR